jgi:hypothetical protein
MNSRVCCDLRVQDMLNIFLVSCQGPHLHFAVRRASDLGLCQRELETRVRSEREVTMI